MLSNFYHQKWVRSLRSFARRIGVLGIIKKVISGRERAYEEAFHEALNSAVTPGDTIWDVGANIGIYTEYFLEWTGSKGKVIAFEPLPQAFATLEQKFKNHPLRQNVELIQMALADRDGEAVFAGDIGGDGISTTGHISDATDRVSGTEIKVKLSTADHATIEPGVKLPTVVKVDVEGFEEDVLKGGQKTFGNKSCKHILIEMHFSRMDERKLGDSASRIVQMLRNWGYKVKWVDPSHLHASRT